MKNAELCSIQGETLEDGTWQIRCHPGDAPNLVLSNVPASFTSQSSQMSIPSTLMRFYSHSQWERQSRVCLLHRIWNQTLLTWILKSSQTEKIPLMPSSSSSLLFSAQQIATPPFHNCSGTKNVGIFLDFFPFHTSYLSLSANPVSFTFRIYSQSENLSPTFLRVPQSSISILHFTDTTIILHLD